MATIAQRATELQPKKTPKLYNALARIKFLQGDKAGAIAMAKQAKDCISDEPTKANEQSKALYQRSIDCYEKGELPTGNLMLQLRGLYYGFEKTPKTVAASGTSPKTAAE